MNAIVLHQWSTKRLHGVQKVSIDKGSGLSTIIYRRSAHGREGGERICSDGLAAP
jgi:hypothetical protein